MNGKQKINKLTTVIDSIVAKKLKVDIADAENTCIEPPKGKENDSNTLKVYPKRSRTPSTKALAVSVEGCVKETQSSLKSDNIPDTSPENELLIPNITAQPGSSSTKSTPNTNPATKECIPLILKTVTEIPPKKTKKNAVKTKLKDGTKRRCMPKTVNTRLEKMGINPANVSSCVKAAMSKGHIIITGDLSDLEQVIFEGPFEDHEFKVLLKDILYQADYGGDYEDGSENATAICSCCDSDDYPGRAYLTRLCQGKTELDSGKFHNHCTRCKGFGTCINDYRMAHCGKCNKHWFTGLMGYPCDNCKRARRQSKGFAAFLQESDDSDDSMVDGHSEGCVLS